MSIIPSSSKAVRFFAPTKYHEALFNVNILREIFAYFRVDCIRESFRETLQNRTTLLWAALTCTSWRDTALNVLWSSLYSLLPLIHVLGNVEKTDSGYIIMNIPVDFDRFDFYARNVKSLLIGGPLGEEDDPKIPTYLYILIAQHYSCQAILPSLRHLYFEIVDRQIDPEVAFLVLSKSLHFLDIHTVPGYFCEVLDENDYLSSLLSLAIRRSPSINWFKLNCVRDCHLESLQKIENFNLTDLAIQLHNDEPKFRSEWRELFLRLTSQKTLNNLTLKITKAFTSSLSFEAPPDSPKEIRALRKLDITGPISSVNNFLNLYTLPSVLRELMVKPSLDSAEVLREIKYFFTMIAKISTLESLTIDLATRASALLTYQDMSHSFESYRNLKVLVIVVKEFDISDEDMYYMMRPLPDPTELRISYSKSSNCSLNSLRIISLLCPNLKELALSISFKNIPSTPVLHLHPLERLVLHANTTALKTLDYIHISRFIYATFPGAGVERFKQTSGWIEIEELMDAYRELQNEHPTPINLSSEIEKILKVASKDRSQQ